MNNVEHKREPNKNFRIGNYNQHNKQFAEGVLSQSRLDTNTENKNSFCRPG